MNIPESINNLLSEILSCDPLDLTAGFPLTGPQGILPIDVAKLALACEKAFRLSLFDEKIAKWHTLGDVYTHISELIEEGQAESTERTDNDRLAWYYE